MALNQEVSFFTAQVSVRRVRRHLKEHGISARLPLLLLPLQALFLHIGMHSNSGAPNDKVGFGNGTPSSFQTSHQTSIGSMCSIILDVSVSGASEKKARGFFVYAIVIWAQNLSRRFDVYALNFRQLQNHKSIGERSRGPGVHKPERFWEITLSPKCCCGIFRTRVAMCKGAPSYIHTVSLTAFRCYNSRIP
ncbi:hypothetical protein TNCV_2817341 [Trichonephila clavipes]|nr:hypothetical protein TNCV_2817341 [Trichonephila clavipes]